MDPFAQPYYKIEAADAFYVLRINDLAISGAEQVVKLDPINPIYMGTLATMYETMGKYSDAIKQRTDLINYDPNNAKNYLQLIKLYKQVGDLNSATKMYEKIISLAPNSEAANLAKAEIQ
jgi:tetratricopeptide (TPR) repeat protein